MFINIFAAILFCLKYTDIGMENSKKEHTLKIVHTTGIHFYWGAV
jgi:hypothetical protein